MTAKCYFILFFLVVSTGIYGRNHLSISVDSIRDHFVQQVQAFPQEKIYVQTDKSIYIAGETLWFKVYLTDAVVHFPSEYSRFVYVEWINPLGSLINREKIRIAPGQSCGQIKISEKLPEGNYTLRAYSGTMYGMDEDYLFHKNIYVHSPFSIQVKDSVSFEFEDNKITASIRLGVTDEKKNNQPKKLKVQVNGDSPKTIRTDKEGIADFSFKLSDDNKKRILHLEWEDDDYFFSKYFPIPVPEEDYDLSFFPEGGNLLEGVACKVGFKALKSDGLSENISGSIVDGEGNVIIPSFQSLHKGMGSFSLIPGKGKTYYALVKNEKNKEHRFLLPKAVEGTYSLSAQWNKSKVQISVKCSSDIQPDSSLFLVIHSRGVVEYAAPWNFSTPYLVLNKTNFSSGILQVLLLDKNWNPLSERLLFCINDDQADLSLRVNKEKFNIRELVDIQLNVNDKAGKPLSGNFSISVTNDNDVAPDTTTNILTCILLTSELKGYIEDPAFYFKANTIFTNEALDNLMLTQGWRRYNIPEIMKENYAESPGFIEIGQEISGSVKGLIRGKGIPDSQIKLFSLDIGYANVVVADGEGNFTINDLNFPKNTSFIVQAFTNKGDDRVELQIKEDEYPPVEVSYIPVPTIELPPSSENLSRISEEFIDGMRMIHLREVQIKASKKKKESTDNPLTTLASKSFNREKIEEINATHLEELLWRVPGLQIEGNRFIFNGSTTIRKIPAAIAIDGIIVESYEDESPAFDLSQINMMDIERVDIYRGLSSGAAWGPRGAAGVVSITTRKGEFSSLRANKTQFNSKVIYPLGYLVPDEFYSPKYETEAQKSNIVPDFRSTLFWKPNIHTGEDGKASLNFYTSDNVSSYSVIVEGITNDGLILHKILQINK
jgi:hypothetical protein